MSSSGSSAELGLLPSVSQEKAAVLQVKPEKGGAQYQSWVSLVGGSIAASTSKTVTAPLSRMTILMQIQGMEGGSRVGAGAGSIVSSLRASVREQGVRSLWRGNLTSVLHKFPYGGLNYFSYEKTKIFLKPYWTDQNNPGVAVRLVGGFTGGAVASLGTYPLDLIRTRLSAQSSSELGIGGMLREVVLTEGGRGLFKGVGSTLLCQGGNLAINFAIYESLQREAMRVEERIFGRRKDKGERTRSTFFSTLVCGSVAAMTSSCLIFPLDLLRRQQQMHRSSPPPFWTLGAQIVRKEGLRGLYRGLAPELVKVCPAVAINFYVYELVRQELFKAEIAPR